VPNLILGPELAIRPYRVAFHVRTPARCARDLHEQLRNAALERMIRDLAKRGWMFERLDPAAPRGPLPVVPVKGFGKKPPKLARGQPAPKDDSLWRVSSLPTFGPKAAHLMTDEVDWEYHAIFSRPTIPTAYLEGDATPWLKS
jgi:hypothetical protein